jgi:hypothetical protein
MTPATKAFDTRRVAGIDSTGTHVLHTYSNLNATGHYVQHSLSPSNADIGQTITIKFIGKETLFSRTAVIRVNPAKPAES